MKNLNPLYLLTEVVGWRVFYSKPPSIDYGNIDYLLLRRAAKNYVQNLLSKGYTKQQAIQKLLDKTIEMEKRGKPTIVTSTGHKFWNQNYKKPIIRLRTYLYKIMDKVDKEQQQLPQKDIRLLDLK